jgi:CreA protein
MRIPLIAVILALVASTASAEEIGSVDTVFKLFGPDHKIVIEAFDDPNVPGVTCHISRAKAGGIRGAVGLAEDPSDASIACRQVGPITLPDKLEAGDEVFTARTSVVFKELHVVRFFDQKRNVLIYLVYSDKLIEGSPKNAISSVPIRPWLN